VHELALPVAAIVALALAPGLLAQLRAYGHVRANYRERPLPFPFGLLIVLASSFALVLLAPLQQLDGAAVFYSRTVSAALYVFGVALLGLLDDAFGQTLAGAPRGWRAHALALRRGEVSTGAIKALGTVGLALFTLSTLSLSSGRWLLGSAVLVLATHVLNLLDLRPGRAIKALVLLGAGLTIAAGTRALFTLGLFLGPALVAGYYDLRERAMLGDTGASVLGGLAGLWLVLTLSSAGQAVALALLLAIALFAEFQSISELVERLPLLRHLDCVGRPSR
jgi:UDP-N-acetylmuramyl pentapeptide phosphotransferase/UDP-N-acetylglucosamine-1-phosphate transferase